MTTALEGFRRNRRQGMLAAVEDALRRLEEAGAHVNISRVAAAAGVSRQWLYGSPYRTEIETLRARHTSRSKSKCKSTRQAASEASLLAQNETLRERLKELRKENATLRQELALALGNLRSRR